MTTESADRAIAAVHRALLKYGVEAALRAVPLTGPSHNPTLGSPVETPCRVMRADWDFKEQQDSRILSTDTKFALEADGLALTGADLLKHKLAVPGSPPYTVVKATPRELQGKTVFWWLQARA